MNELSTDINTHWIITFGKSHHPITSKQEQALVNMSGEQFIKVGNDTIKVSNIAEILSNETYKLTYPNKVSYNYGQPFTPLPPDPIITHKTIDQKMGERKSWLEAGLRGLKKAQQRHKWNNNPSPNCDEMIRKLELKIANFNEND